MPASLPPDLDAYVREQVAQGEFSSADEAIATAVRLMRDDTERLRKMIAEGVDDLENGRYTDYDLAGLRDLFDKLKARATGNRGS